MSTVYWSWTDVASTDYEKAKAVGLTEIHRWAEGREHHPMSIRLMAFLAEYDLRDYNNSFCWKTGGDGDNGETLMYQLDAFFELLCPFAETALVNAEWLDTVLRQVCPRRTRHVECCDRPEGDDLFVEAFLALLTTRRSNQ